MSLPSSKPVQPGELLASAVDLRTAVSEPIVAGTPFSHYWRQIAPYRWIIIAFVVAVTAGATLYTLTLTKLYDAAAILRIDNAATPSVTGDGAQNPTSNDPQLIVSTAQQVLTTPAVVNAMIAAQHLGQDAEFAPPKTMQSSAWQERLELNVARNILVTRPPGTLLLEVHFRSADPAVSAAVANGLAQAFLEHEYKTRYEALTQASQYMTAQLASLQAQSEKSQEDLVNYESQASVLDPDDKTNVMQARLNQISTDYTKAQTARIASEAEYQLVRAGDRNALMLTPAGDNLRPLYQTLTTDQRSLAHLATLYGPKHPLLIAQQKLVDHDQAALLTAEARVEAQITSQYRAALSQEALLAGLLDQQRTAMDAFNRKAITYRALKASADSLSKLYFDLQQRIQEDNVAAGFRSEGLRITSPALPSYEPVYPRTVLVAVLSLLFSTTIAIGAAFLWSTLDQSIVSAAQLEQLFALPVLASLPAGAGSDIESTPHEIEPPGQEGAELETEKRLLRQRSAFREAVLGLHSVLALSPRPVQAIAVTSAVPAEGKSTVSSNLALAFALLGRRTVLVDADMRKPSIHRRFGVANRLGLSSVLRGQLELDAALIESGHAGLTLLPAGPTSAMPAELLQRGFLAIAEELRARFDMIVVDCTPTLGFSDALSIGNAVDGLLVVVKAGSTPRQYLGAALRAFRGAHAEVIGIVLNQVSEKADYGYYRYYSYYSKSEDEHEEAPVLQ